MNRMLALLLIALFPAFGVSCGGSDRDLEDYGAVTQLTLESHPSGYGRDECLLCHNASLNVHRSIKTVVDTEELLRRARKEGSRYCMSCHGTNGVKLEEKSDE